WLARVGRIDMPLTLMVSIVLSTLYLRHDLFSGRPRGGAPSPAPPRGRPLSVVFLSAAYSALAAGILLKGPIALVLPGAALVLYLVVEGDWRHPIQLARRLGLWWGLPLSLGIAAIWFVWAERATHDDLFRTFFLH